MQGRRTPGRGWIEGVLARRPMGVIAVFSDLSPTDARAAAGPATSRSSSSTRPASRSMTRRRSERRTGTAGSTATRHLLGLGHRRIGVIGGPPGILCSRARLDGYRAAMDEAGVPIDPRLISHGRFHVDEGIEKGRALLRLAERPTAIFAGNDLQALGVYQAAREARLHIPEDLSVVGFDDLPVARWVGPPLTTVRQPLVEMAETAAELVLDLAARRDPRPRPASSSPPSSSSARAPRRRPELRCLRLSPRGPAAGPGPRPGRRPRSSARSIAARTAGPRPSTTRR